jgi:hypothetical protein
LISAFAKSAKLVSGWDFDTIIPSHGETMYVVLLPVIPAAHVELCLTRLDSTVSSICSESGGKQSWNANFRDFLDMA